NDELAARVKSLLQGSRLAPLHSVIADVVHDIKGPIASIHLAGDYLLRHLRVKGERNLAVVLQELKRSVRKTDAVKMSLTSSALLKSLEDPAGAGEAERHEAKEQGPGS